MFTIYVLMRLMVNEEIRGHGEANYDDYRADVLGIHFLRVYAPP